jgi:uncharacterized protein YggE
VSNVSSLSFTIADEGGVQADARKLAIDEAQEKAEKLASDLGVQLVRIIGFHEEGGGQPMPFMRAMAMDMEEVGMGGSMEATIPAGENQIVSRVSITYEIR